MIEAPILKQVGERTTIGSFELIHVNDGTYNQDGGAFFGVVPRMLWERKIQADERNLIPSSLNSVLVRDGKNIVLIETGIGNKLEEKKRKVYGHQELLLTHLAQVGIEPGQVTHVINSHLHFDHCGWNTCIKDGKVVPTFPNAMYFAQRGEWGEGCKQRERDAVSYLSDNYDPLIKSGQMKLLSGPGEILPGISVEIYPGHTRYMQAIMIQSGGKTACYISDLIPTAAHMDLVWGMGYDLYPLETIESKKRFYARAIPEEWLILFTHDPFRPWGYAQDLGGGKYGLRG